MYGNFDSLIFWEMVPGEESPSRNKFPEPCLSLQPRAPEPGQEEKANVTLEKSRE